MSTGVIKVVSHIECIYAISMKDVLGFKSDCQAALKGRETQCLVVVCMLYL